MSAVLEVIGGSAYLVEQEQQARRIANLLSPIVNPLLFMAGAAWIFVGFLVFTDQQQPIVNLFLAAVGLLSVAALLVPGWRDSAETTANNYQRGIAGEQRLETVLNEILTGEWVLFKNVVLPGYKGDIDGILVGEKGIFALEVKNYSNTHQITNMKWQYRDDKEEWQTTKTNPSSQAKRNAERLQTWLSTEDVAARVLPRVVWASDTLLLADESAIPIWMLNHPQPMREDIEKQEPMEETIMQQMRGKLAGRANA